MSKKHFRYIYITTGFALTELFSSHMAIASDDAHSGGGFPQFEASTYPSQIFWLVVSFVLTYLILSRIALPKIAYVLDLRNAQREGNLAEAERLNDKAEVSLQEYDQALAETHEEVRVILQKTKDDILKLQNKHFEKSQQDTQEKILKTETSLQKSINKALLDVTSSASDLTTHVAKQIANISISNSEATNIVSNIQTEK